MLQRRRGLPERFRFAFPLRTGVCPSCVGRVCQDSAARRRRMSTHAAGVRAPKRHEFAYGFLRIGDRFFAAGATRRQWRFPNSRRFDARIGRSRRFLVRGGASGVFTLTLGRFAVECIRGGSLVNFPMRLHSGFDGGSGAEGRRGWGRVAASDPTLRSEAGWGCFWSPPSVTGIRDPSHTAGLSIDRSSERPAQRRART